jgi:small subunit ribosomal protein S7
VEREQQRQLNKHMRHKKAVKRTIDPDKVYNNLLVAKFINNLMKDGKKTVAEKVVYSSFELLKTKGHDPLDIFDKALQAVGPKVEIKAKRVGGANYQVPVEVKPERKHALAIRWILEAANARPNKEFHTMAEKLVAEFLDAIEDKGAAVAKRNNAVRQAEANRAFASFRW